MSDTAKKAKTEESPLLPLRFSLKDGRACLLRPMVEDDAEELIELLPRIHAESDSVHYFPGEFDKTVEQEREFIRDHNAKGCSIAMVAKVEGRIVGIAGGASIEFRRFAHHADCGLAILRGFWRQGIGRTMMDCLIEWSRRAGHRKLYLKVFDHNERAIKLYTSLGFVEEARLRGDVLRSDGSYGDTIIMAKFFVK